MFNYENTIHRESLIEIAISSFLIIHIMITAISNYSINSIILKLVSTAVFLFLLYMHSRIFKNCLKRIYSQLENNNLYYFLLLLICIPLISLLYSYNKSFGILKIYVLASSTIPTVLGLYYLTTASTRLTYKIFIRTLTIASVILSIFAITASPFNYDGNYGINFQNWSHVVFGRFIGISATVITLVIIYKERLNYYLVAADILIIIGLITTQFRAGIISLVLVIVIALLHQLYSQKEKNKIIRIVGSLVLITAIVGIYQLGNENSRYKSLFMSVTDRNYAEGSISSRQDANRYSMQSVLRNPLLGTGVGGFYSEEVAKEVMGMKYPHNIFLEIAVEYGVLVLLASLVLVITAFRRQYRIHPSISFFFLYNFLLALFSKDLPNQPLLIAGFLFATNFESLRKAIGETK